MDLLDRAVRVAPPTSSNALEPFLHAPFGFEGGYLTEAEVAPRVSQLADGVDVNKVWQEVQQVLNEWNTQASSLTSILSYWHTNSADAVPNNYSDSGFEEASEYGEPVAQRPGDWKLRGFGFKDYDTATRFTWKFLRDATAQQVRAATDQVLSSDTKLVNGKIFQRLFDNTPGVNNEGVAIYPLYNGDGEVPPAYAGNVFDGSASSYLTSGAAELDSGDLENAIRVLRQRGHAQPDSGEQVVVLANPDQAQVISSFRAGVENNNAAVALHDFIPSLGSPAFISDGPVVGKQVAAEWSGLGVMGSYGPALIVESSFIPSGYVLTVASSGSNSAGNVVGVRQHPNAEYQGLRNIPGPVPGYPLQESFYTRGFGTGVRHRGKAIVTQVTTDATYTPPSVIIV